MNHFAKSGYNHSQESQILDGQKLKQRANSHYVKTLNRSCNIRTDICGLLPKILKVTSIIYACYQKNKEPTLITWSSLCLTDVKSVNFNW
jgi:hypothetical protein